MNLKQNGLPYRSEFVFFSLMIRFVMPESKTCSTRKHYMDGSGQALNPLSFKMSWLLGVLAFQGPLQTIDKLDYVRGGATEKCLKFTIPGEEQEEYRGRIEFSATALLVAVLWDSGCQFRKKFSCRKLNCVSISSGTATFETNFHSSEFYWHQF